MLTPPENFHKNFNYEPAEEFVSKVNEGIRNYKVITVTNVPFSNDTAKLYEFYTKISDAIGDYVPIDEDDSGSKTGKRWIDIRFIKERETESYRWSATKQPLHTDGAYESNAPDLTFFFSEIQPELGGSTIFFDGELLVDCLKLYDHDFLNQLENTNVIFDKVGDQRIQKIISYDEKGPLLNFNYFRISEKNEPTAKELAVKFHEFLESKVMDGGLYFPVNLKPGEAVFF
ncbi:TauD/TfdA family dioxygenase, partial [bacterium AH-315-C07]|nr:TauD/TfdA family dioxygenase [bacterium AH-315-C07]